MQLLSNTIKLAELRDSMAEDSKEVTSPNRSKCTADKRRRRNNAVRAATAMVAVIVGEDCSPTAPCLPVEVTTTEEVVQAAPTVRDITEAEVT